MNFAERATTASVALLLACVLAACGGSSSETTIIGGGLSGGTGGSVASIDTPTGDNTTEIVVDSGPASGFSLGAVNIPYVAVTVCSPGSSTACVTIDHVFLDTGSIGLRVLRSAVAPLSLPAVALPADAAHATPAGPAVECYPFVLGAVWGALATADVRVGGELAAALPIQLIDDATPAANAAPPDCVSSSNGGLLNSAASLQANGILGVGMIAYDCGLSCTTANYASGYTLYYSCTNTTCAPAAVPANLQIQNPVAHFAVNNNGTLITMPALPDLGVGIARGRLVFGIGTQTNNQIPPTAKMYFVDANPANATYLTQTTRLDGATFTNSYIDSGSNALFFDNSSIPQKCQSSSGTNGGWYCPATALRKMATFTDSFGTSGSVDVSIASADALFSTSSLAFSNLAGSVKQGANTFVWGMPFFYGRPVFTSIWGKALSPNGPWNAF